MGKAEGQKNMFHTVQLEDLVPGDHPLRKIRPLVDTERIRELCKDFYCADNGRPSIPPEQLFLAMLGGYLLGARSDRRIIMELKCNMAFRWFVGLDIDSKVWDDTTFSKNREHRFDEANIFETLFDDTVKRAVEGGWVSDHWSMDGTLVRANASHKSFVPLEVRQSPKAFRETVSGEKKGKDGMPIRRATDCSATHKDGDKGNPSVDFRGEKRSNATHRSTTDPDARIATKSNKETSVPGYTVNGVMENRNRILMGIGVEIFRGSASERDGGLSLLERAKRRLGLRPKTLGADKGYFEKKFIKKLFKRWIEPHVATESRGRDKAHMRVRMRERGLGYGLSQRARKKIEELWGEGKDWHGLRRFARRMLVNVRQEAWMIGWLLNLKRLASIQAMATA
jgi:transposase